MADKKRDRNNPDPVGHLTEEEADDFIIIDMDKCETSATNEETSNKTPEISSVDSGLDVDDYVEVTYNDIQQDVCTSTVIVIIYHMSETPCYKICINPTVYFFSKYLLMALTCCDFMT